MHSLVARKATVVSVTQVSSSCAQGRYIDILKSRLMEVDVNVLPAISKSSACTILGPIIYMSSRYLILLR